MLTLVAAKNRHNCRAVRNLRVTTRRLVLASAHVRNKTVQRWFIYVTDVTLRI